MNRFIQIAETEHLHPDTEHDIFTKANAPLCELTNKSTTTLGNRKSIILIKKQGLFLLFK